MRILLTGASGQVGTEFRRIVRMGDDALAPGREELDLSDERSVRRYIREARPEIVVNAGAYTAVDLAEGARPLLRGECRGSGCFR
jgi:dTDP-4-dehydrorhamnose reductase